MQSKSHHRTQVLIVGGSLVGLSAALFLAWRGVDTVVVEKHRGSAPHPRAVGFTGLTLEHYRATGIEARIPQVAPDVRLRRVKVESLSGRWAEESHGLQAKLYGAVAMELGQRVSSAAVIATHGELPPAADPDVWAGQPGTRVPHVWTEKVHQRLSTIDLFTQSLTLVSRDTRWLAASRRVTQATGVPIAAIHVGRDIVFPEDIRFEATFGLREGGACLVRPDAIVAWRAVGIEADPESALRHVIARITGLHA